MKEGGERASATASTQKEAEKIAKEFSGNSGGGEVRIHNLTVVRFVTAIRLLRRRTRFLPETKNISHAKELPKTASPIRRHLEKLTEQDLVAGCSRVFSADDIQSGKLQHLGVQLSSGGLKFPKSIIPPETAGKASGRNVNGYVVVRKDLPKETRYNTIEAPNWGDSYNGTHPVDLPYEAYPRDQYSPMLAQIKISCPDPGPGKPSYTLVFEVDRVFDRKVKDFAENLLEAINLLQENVGASGVQKADATFSGLSKDDDRVVGSAPARNEGGGR